MVPQKVKSVSTLPPLPYVAMNLQAFNEKPYAYSLAIISLCGRESNALLRSINKVHTIWPLSKALFQSSIRFTTTFSQPVPCLYADSLSWKMLSKKFFYYTESLLQNEEIFLSDSRLILILFNFKVNQSLSTFKILFCTYNYLQCIQKHS